MKMKNRLDLDTIAGGAIPSGLTQAMNALLENVLDETRPWDEKRKLVMTITVEAADPERTAAAVDIKIERKLSAPSGAHTIITMEQEGPDVVVREKQLQLAFSEESQV